LNKSENLSAVAIRDSIPEDEAVFYENEAAEEVSRLASLKDITGVASVSPSLSFATLARIFMADSRDECPEPKSLCLAATFECPAEYEALSFIAPLRNKAVLQLGGKGTEAVKFSLAGAKEACLVSPVESELQCCKELARLCGVAVSCKPGTAESIPFGDNSFDVVYSSGCAHHFKTVEAFPEISRVLRSGGRFAAVEPWRAPLYSMGTKMFGKRETEVHCRPLTKERVHSLSESFRCHDVRQHGTLSRYPMIALCTLGFMIPLSLAWWLFRADDRLCSLLGLRVYGSCAAVLAEK
jgi:SAM-dependent methyltransferase